jgi:hypothetical protein
MNTEPMVSALRAEADRLSKAADLLEPRPAPVTTPQPNTILRNAGKRTGSRVISKATRERLSRAQKARWAERKAAQPQAA